MMNVQRSQVERIDALIAESERLKITSGVEALRRSEEALALAVVIGDQARIGLSYLAKGHAYYCCDHLDAALEMFAEARALCDEHDNPTGMAKILIGEASVHQKTGRHSEAQDLLAMAIDLAERGEDDLLRAAALRKIGYSYGANGNFSLYTEYLFRALEIWERVDPMQAGPALHGLAAVFERVGLLDKAHEYLVRALKAAHDTNDRGGEATTLGSIGAIHEKNGEFETALSYYHTALRITREASFRYLEIYQLISIARLLGSMDRKAEAIEWLFQALPIAREMGFRERAVDAIRAISALYVDERRFQEAIDMARPALRDAVELGNDFSTMRLHQILTRAYEGVGDLRHALDHFKSMMEMHKNDLNRDQPKTLLLLEERLGLKAAERERDTLREQQALLEHEIRYKNRDLSTMSLMLRQREEALVILRQQISRAAGNESQSDAVAPEAAEVEGPAMADQLWTDFGRQIDSIHAEFIHVLVNRYPRLTSTDLKICSLLKLNLTTKEIARLMGLAPKSVEIYRTRIRKKLALRSDDNLRSILQSFH